VLDPAQCYQSHADIDDRYHLNIQGEECFLINLIQEQMHKLEQDGIWYDMDAGFLHTAANFGKWPRVQLVVRKLLKRNILKNPIKITITSTLKYQSRYTFDNYLSPWLNSANKHAFISDFEYSEDSVTFAMEQDQLDSLKRYMPEGLVINL
jgi:hypothetical protein